MGWTNLLPTMAARARSNGVIASAGEDDLTLNEVLERLASSESLDDPKIPIVFGCLLKIITRVQALPVRITAPSGTIVPNPSWVVRPSRVWSWRDVISQAVWSLLMYGDLYLWPSFDAASRVNGVIVVDPDVVKTYKVPDNKILPDIVQTVNGYPVPELIHTRYLSSPGLIRGIGVKKVSTKARQLSSMSEETLLRHFVQGARLQVVFSTKDPLTPEALKEATRRVRAHYEGVANAWRPVMLGSGITVSVLSQGAEQAQYLQLSQWSDARIASQIFGIDPTLLGINLPGSQLTYSNAIDREANLWRDAIRPPVTALEEAFGALVALGRKFELVEMGLLTGGPRDRVAYAKELAEVNAKLGVWLVLAQEIRDAIGLPISMEPLELLKAATPEPEPTEPTEPTEEEEE